MWLSARLCVRVRVFVSECQREREREIYKSEEVKFCVGVFYTRLPPTFFAGVDNNALGLDLLLGLSTDISSFRSQKCSTK